MNQLAEHGQLQIKARWQQQLISYPIFSTRQRRQRLSNNQDLFFFGNGKAEGLKSCLSCRIGIGLPVSQGAKQCLSLLRRFGGDQFDVYCGVDLRWQSRRRQFYG